MAKKKPKPKPAVDKLPLKKQLTAGQVEAGLRRLNGNLAAVGRSLGVTRQAVSQMVAKRPALQAVALECRETMLDDAEDSLGNAVRAGESWAVCFYLKTQGKARGYVERSEHAVTGDVTITIVEEVVGARSKGAGPGAPGAGGVRSQ